MPDWRDDLRECSYRGIACRYRNASIQRGRRLAVHEYPHRETADVEDLGRSNPRFRLDLYLLDSEAPGQLNARRDALLAALEQPGPGTLVHPYHGTIQVHAESVRESYSTREGGMVRLSVAFVEAAAARLPGVATDTAIILNSRSNALATAAKDAFRADYDTAGWPEFVRDSAELLLDQATDALDLGREGLSVIDDWADLIADAAAIANTLFAARSPLADAGMGRIRVLRDFGSDLPAYGNTTPSIRRQAGNQTAIVTIVRLITLTSALDHVSERDFASFDDAIRLRDDLLGQIDDHGLASGDNVYNALIDARAALIDDIANRAGPLARLRPYTPNATLPAIALAWTLYADADRGADIVARNNIPNPGFVPGGEQLEVLDA